MDIVLIAGLWLDGSVRDNVADQLKAHGHQAVPVTLPGQDDGAHPLSWRNARTLPMPTSTPDTGR